VFPTDVIARDMSVTPMTHVVALRQTSDMMAALIDALALKESFGLRRIAAAVFCCLRRPDAAGGLRALCRRLLNVASAKIKARSRRF